MGKDVRRLTINIFYPTPDENCTTDSFVLTPDNYDNLLSNLNNLGATYNLGYSLNSITIYLNNPPDEDVLSFLYDTNEISNKLISLDMDEAELCREASDQTENRYCQDDGSDVEIYEELPDNDCLEGGTGQWAHN